MSDSDGLAELRAATSKEQRENLWVVATSGNDLAVVTPSMYAFSAHEGSNWTSYVYTDRPVYRPGHSVHWKAILRQRVENHLELPKLSSIHVRIADQEDRPVFEKDLPVSAIGTVDGDFALAANASLGYYTIRLGNACRRHGGRVPRRGISKAGVPGSRNAGQSPRAAGRPDAGGN